MFTTIREPKPYHVNLDSQSFWAPETAAHPAHSTQKTKQPIPVPTPALKLKLQEESSSDVKINLNRLPAVSGYHFDKRRTVPSNTAHVKAQRNEDAEGTCHNVQEVHTSQSVDMLLSVDMATTSLAKTPPDETKSFESIVGRRLESPSMVFDSDKTGEPGWIDLPTINQATEEAAVTSNRLAKHLSIPPPAPPALHLSQADKASQTILESIIPPVNCLLKPRTPAQINSIPETPISACSSIQQFLGNSAERGIDASGDWSYWVGSEPCQSTIKPLQGTEDSCIPSSPNQTGYGHSFPYDEMGGIGNENNNDDSNDGDDSSFAHNGAEGSETSSSEKEAADYDSEQPVHKRRRTRQSLATNTPPRTNNDIIHGETSGSKENAADYDNVQLPRKRIKVRESLGTNTSYRGYTPRFSASIELLKQMGKIIPSSGMLNLASSLSQDPSNNGDTGAADAIIYEEITFPCRLRFSSVDGTKAFHMQWEFPQDTDGSQEESSPHIRGAEEGRESSITHPSGAECRHESAITQRTFQTTPRREIRKTTTRTSHIPFSRQEEELLAKLKEGKKKLSWRDIHRKFSKQFPGRSCASLQVRYSTKLKRRMEV